MKRTLLFLPLLLCLYFSCQKNENLQFSLKSEDPFVVSAIEYLKTQISHEDFKKLNFNDLKLLTDGNKTIAAQIFTKNKSNNKFVFLSKDKEDYVGNWVEYLPVNDNSHSINDGIIKTENFAGSFKSELAYLNNMPVKFTRTVNGVTKITIVKYPQKNSLNSDNPTTTEIGMGVQMREIDEGNVLPPVTVTTYISNTFTTLYCLYYYNPSPSYQYSYTPTQPYNTGGGGSSGSNYTYTTLISPPPDGKHIGDITDYLKCFTNSAGSTNTYTVTICVDQPIAGSREPWALSGDGSVNSSSGTNPINVGHTFLILTETTPTGTISRNVGFYPTDAVKPAAPVSQGQLINNDDQPYDISLTVSMTNSQFYNILSFVSQGNNTGYSYDLNNNNCTSFALHALSAGSIILRSSVGSWAGGGGNNPGDLGEDIRAMTLEPNMTRNTTNTSHPNLGTCY